VIDTSVIRRGFGRGSKTRIKFTKKFVETYFPTSMNADRTLFLNFVAADRCGLLKEKTINGKRIAIDVTDLAIIAYLQYWIFHVKKKITAITLGKTTRKKYTYVLIKYDELFENIPCLPFKTKQALISRLDKLALFNIIKKRTKLTVEGSQAYIRFSNAFRNIFILPDLYRRFMQDCEIEEYARKVAGTIAGYDLSMPDDFFRLLERSFNIIKGRLRSNGMERTYQNVSVYGSDEQVVIVARWVVETIFNLLFALDCSFNNRQISYDPKMNG